LATYRYTELDDLQEVIRIAFDKSETTERRILAVIDLGYPRDRELAHRFLDILADKTEPPALRGEVCDKMSDSWDTRAVPVLAQALQDESVEVRFWAAFAVYTARYHIPDSARYPLIPLLDKLVASDAVYEGWWHEGREALAPMEMIYFRKIAPPHRYSHRLWLISPMPEYMTLERLKWQGKPPPEHSPLNIDANRLKYHLRQRFYDVKFDVRHPRLTCYQLNWQIGSGKKLLLGALHRDGYGVVLTGRDMERIARFTLWYRSLISAKIPLYLYAWADVGLELRHGMKLAEITQGTKYWLKVFP
jgi:hypothetical protein